MDGLRLDAGLLGHAFGGASGRRGEQDFDALGGENAQDSVKQRRLADAGTASDHSSLAPSAISSAARCEAASVLPVFFSTQGAALSASIAGHGGRP